MIKIKKSACTHSPIHIYTYSTQPSADKMKHIESLIITNWNSNNNCYSRNAKDLFIKVHTGRFLYVNFVLYSLTLLCIRYACDGYDSVRMCDMNGWMDRWKKGIELKEHNMRIFRQCLIIYYCCYISVFFFISFSLLMKQKKKQRTYRCSAMALTETNEERWK